MSRRQGIEVRCDRCGQPAAFVGSEGPIHVRSDEVATQTYPGEHLAAQEVWFSPPGNRSGVSWTDEDGQLNESRVRIFDSCNRCAARAMELIEGFYTPEGERPATLT